MRSLRKSDNAPGPCSSRPSRLFFLCRLRPGDHAGKEGRHCAAGRIKDGHDRAGGARLAEALMTRDKAEAFAEKEKATAGRPARGQEASGLKAGYADDNKQFNYYVHFLEQYAAQRSIIRSTSPSGSRSRSSMPRANPCRTPR